MSSDWGNEWAEWQWQLPTRLTRENPPCPEGFHLLGTSEVQKKTKSQVLGIFPWPLRCDNDQRWLSDAHWESLCAQPSSRHLVRTGDMSRVCAHPGSLQPGQEPKASTWTMKSQHDRIMKLVQIKWWCRCQGCLLLACSTPACWAPLTYRFIPELQRRKSWHQSHQFFGYEIAKELMRLYLAWWLSAVAATRYT